MTKPYDVDLDLPLGAIPGALARSLDDSCEFEVVSEVSTDWPSTSSVAGLRELAGRYRAEYLLLYRHRFVDSAPTVSRPLPAEGPDYEGGTT